MVQVVETEAGVAVGVSVVGEPAGGEGVAGVAPKPPPRKRRKNYLFAGDNCPTVRFPNARVTRVRETLMLV
jgi:hypothetical protein